MRYEVTIDNEDMLEVPETPWNAAAYSVLEGGRTGDTFLVGTGATPAEALQDLASEWARQERVILFGTNYEGLIRSTP